MAVDVLGGSTQWAMFCTTSMFAFGPVLASREAAEDFRSFCFDHIGDPRAVTDGQLEATLGEFYQAHPEHDDTE